MTNPRPALRRRLEALRDRGITATAIAESLGMSVQGMSAILLSKPTRTERRLVEIEAAISKAEGQR